MSALSAGSRCSPPCRIVPLPRPDTPPPAGYGYVVPPMITNFCRVCGLTFGPRTSCARCHAPTGTIANPNDATCATFLHVGYPYPPPAVSGFDPSQVLERNPEAGWNWGAMFLGPIWAIGNRAWGALATFLLISLLTGLFIVFDPDGLSGESAAAGYVLFIVLYGLFALYLGGRGNALAWKHRTFGSVAEFRAVQNVWSRRGTLIFAVVTGVLTVVGYLLSR